ncbi:betaine-aldehyde dehydrogenase [Selenomonas sp.]|uniref:betaine-aldehyde dehydrogenase n=1 Tax=Selenomonas sp. TaxID=2053611 RepID=UPI003FA33556
MKKKYWVNGKVTYPQGETSVTNFMFTSTETGEMFSLHTTDHAEADTFTYGDCVVMEIRKDTDPPQGNNKNQTEQH